MNQSVIMTLLYRKKHVLRPFTAATGVRIPVGTPSTGVVRKYIAAERRDRLRAEFAT
jgi:hypothetical protein